MIPLLLTASSFLNFVFYIYAIGFVIALGLEQIVLRGDNERNIYIVQSNRRYLWRQTWIVNINWFLCNVGLYLISGICNRLQTIFGKEDYDNTKLATSLQKGEETKT